MSVQPRETIRQTGHPTTLELEWLSGAGVYLTKIDNAKKQVGNERFAIFSDIVREVPDCPELFALVLSAFPDLKQSFIETHKLLAIKLGENPSFTHRTYRGKDKEIDPDATGGFTGFYLEDVLEAVYFLYGVSSPDHYKAGVGIIKLLGGIKKTGERTEEETKHLGFVKPPGAVEMIPSIVEIMEINEDDLELLQKYTNSPNYTEEKKIEKQIRDKYPMQQNLFKDIGIG